MAKKKKRPACKACKGEGYLVTCAGNRLQFLHGQTPTFYETSENIPEIQRCDACEVLSNDNEAQECYLEDVRQGRVELPDLLLLWSPRSDVGRKRNAKA